MRKFVLLASLLALGTSCSKKEDPAPVICYLTTMVYASSYLETLIYDDKNRVISIVSASLGSTADTATFVYGSDDNLASANFGNGTGATYSFDSQNRMILQTFSPSGVTLALTYNTTGQNTVRTYSDPACSACGYSQTFNYPNTTTHNYHSLAYQSASGATYSETYEYDDHPNPYKPVLYSSTGTDNNFTKVVSTIDGTTTFTYTYNDKGYPITQASSTGAEVMYSYNCK